MARAKPPTRTTSLRSRRSQVKMYRGRRLLSYESMRISFRGQITQRARLPKLHQEICHHPSDTRTIITKQDTGKSLPFTSKRRKNSEVPFVCQNFDFWADSFRWVTMPSTTDDEMFAKSEKFIAPMLPERVHNRASAFPMATP